VVGLRLCDIGCRRILLVSLHGGELFLELFLVLNVETLLDEVELHRARYEEFAVVGELA
jgi:hypothetical protein